MTRGSFGAFAVVAALSVASPASSDERDVKLECASAYERAQIRQKNRQLLAARSDLLVCLRDACPEVARQDCARWMKQLEHDLPTIVFDVRGHDGRERRDVRVDLDGTVLFERNDSAAVAVDPGTHRLRFEAPGSPPVEREITVREGERGRKVVVSFTESASGIQSRPDDGAREVPVSVYVVAAVAGVGFTTAAIFGIAGVAREKDLRSSCAPTCVQDDVDGLARMYTVADVALATAVVATGVALVLYWTRPSSPPSSAGRPYSIAF